MSSISACQLKLFKLNSAQKIGKLSKFYHLSFASVNIHRLFHSPNFTSAIKQLLKYLEQHICNIKFSRSDEKECTGQTFSFRFLGAGDSRTISTKENWVQHCVGWWRKVQETKSLIGRRRSLGFWQQLLFTFIEQANETNQSNK